MMKKSAGGRRKQFVPEGVRTSLPKPKIPRAMLWVSRACSGR
jgi:hypothetical protein